MDETNSFRNFTWILQYVGDFLDSEKDVDTVLPNTIPLENFPLLIGRARENGRGTIYLSDKRASLVSREHARICLSAQQPGQLTLTEITKALNGTFLNGIRLETSQPRELFLGDLIDFGVVNGSRVPIGGSINTLPSPTRRPALFKLQQVQYKLPITLMPGPVEKKEADINLKSRPRSKRKSKDKQENEILSNEPQVAACSQEQIGTVIEKDKALPFTITLAKPSNRNLGMQIITSKNRGCVLISSFQENALPEVKKKLRIGDAILSLNDVQVCETKQVVQMINSACSGKELCFTIYRPSATKINVPANPPIPEKSSSEGTVKTTDASDSDTPVPGSYSAPGQKAKFLGEVEDSLVCCICLEPLAFTAMLHCGHSFCWKCIDDVLESKVKKAKDKLCPSCQKVFERSDLRRNVAIDKVIDIMMSKKPEHSPDVQDWKERRTLGQQLANQQDMVPKRKPEHNEPDIPEGAEVIVIESQELEFEG